MVGMAAHTLLVLFYLAIFESLTVHGNKQAVDGPSSTNIDGVLRKHFSFIRHQQVNATAKQKTRDFITDRFKGYGLMTEIQNFTGSGENIIGVLKGSSFGTKYDEIVSLLTHYDTVKTSPGVDDNGAAMSVLIDVARVITNKAKSDPKYCHFTNTIIFVATDYEERTKNSSCTSGICGSEHFVNWFNNFLSTNYVKGQPKVHGFVVMDTILNWNDTDNSQNTPAGFGFAFPAQESLLSANKFRGDFITSIGRSVVPDEDKLLDEFTMYWNRTSKLDKYKNIPLKIALEDPKEIYDMFGDFTRSDHFRLWMGNYSAIFLTDSANFRGSMEQCYHQACDDVDSITDDKIGFVLHTARTLHSFLETRGAMACTSSSHAHFIKSGLLMPFLGLLKYL